MKKLLFLAFIAIGFAQDASAMLFKKSATEKDSIKSGEFDIDFLDLYTEGLSEEDRKEAIKSRYYDWFKKASNYQDLSDLTDNYKTLYEGFKQKVATKKWNSDVIITATTKEGKIRFADFNRNICNNIYKELIDEEESLDQDRESIKMSKGPLELYECRKHYNKRFKCYEENSVLYQRLKRLDDAIVQYRSQEAGNGFYIVAKDGQLQYVGPYNKPVNKTHSKDVRVGLNILESKAYHESLHMLEMTKEILEHDLSNVSQFQWFWNNSAYQRSKESLAILNAEIEAFKNQDKIVGKQKIAEGIEIPLSHRDVFTRSAMPRSFFEELRSARQEERKAICE